MTTQNRELTEELFRRGTLMHLHVRRWIGVKKMRKHDLLMDHVDEEALYLGHKKLLPKKAMEKIISIEGRARAMFSSRSVEFPLPGIRFVAFNALSEVLSDLREIREEFNREVDVLMLEYPALKAQQLALLDAEAEKIAKEDLKKVNEGDGQLRDERQETLDKWLAEQKAAHQSFYPTAEELRASFGISWRMFTISALSGVEELSQLSLDEINAAKAQLRTELQGWVRSATAEMHRALGQAAAQAKNLLEKNEKLDPRNLRPLFNAFENFAAVDFTGASDFRTTVEEIKRRFLVLTPDGSPDYQAMSGNIRERSADEFSQLLSSLSNLAVESVAEEAGIKAVAKVGEFSRVLDL